MSARKLLGMVLVGMLVVGFARPAWANGMSPVSIFWPGFLVASPLLGLPATLLAAFLERPFVTRAGVRRHGLAYSIRANLLSWLIGALVAIVFFASPMEVFLLAWLFGSIPLTIWIEESYLRHVAAKEATRLGGRWIIAGNLASALLLIAIGPISSAIGQSNPLWAWNLRPYEEPLSGGLGVLSLAIVVYALWPRRVEVVAAGPQGSPGPLQHEQAEHELREPVGV